MAECVTHFVLCGTVTAVHEASLNEAASAPVASPSLYFQSVLKLTSTLSVTGGVYANEAP
jgi:hypothetical protein